MPFLDRLERALGRFAIPNAGLYLVIGQAVVLLGVMLRVVDPERLDLAPALVTVSNLDSGKSFTVCGSPFLRSLRIACSVRPFTSFIE